jgi:hypothetical protein
VLPLIARVIVKSGFIASVFFLIALLLEREIFLARLQYIWRLLKNAPLA